MRDTDLFRMALGIEPPWVVTKSEFDAAGADLDEIGWQADGWKTSLCFSGSLRSFLA
jgi:hypothetical protein